MLRGGDVNEIIELRRQGFSITQISTLTGYDRKTIRKYLKTPKLPRYGPRPKRGSRLDPFAAYIEERLSAGVWDAVVLLAELKARGYQGGYTTFKDYLRPRRHEAASVAVRRFETPPGQQAQVDWRHHRPCRIRDQQQNKQNTARFCDDAGAQPRHICRCHD